MNTVVIFLYGMRIYGFLHIASHFFDDKEIIMLPNGFKIYYINNTDTSTTSVNFKISLSDVPSNTGLYSLLANIISNGKLKEYIHNHLGSFMSIINSLSFSFEVLSIYLPESRRHSTGQS